MAPRLHSNPAQLAQASAAPNRNMYLNPRLQQGGPGQIGIPSGEKSLVDRTPSPAVPLVGNQNTYLNPRLQQGPNGLIGNSKGEDVKKVFDIMSKGKKRNPVLVGDSELDVMTKELFRKIENNEFGNDMNLKNVQVISMEKWLLFEKDHIPTKIEELERVIEGMIRNGGVILDLGDLEWNGMAGRAAEAELWWKVTCCCV